MKRKIHILGSGNAAKRHREAIERFPEVYTITGYGEADIVDCCGVPADNFERACEAMFAGKDAILEKPFARNLEDLEEISELETIYDQRVYPVLNYRHKLPVDLGCGKEHFLWMRGPSYYDGWRGKKDQAFGGVLMSHGIHFIDSAISKIGQVGAVFCRTYTGREYDCEVETGAEVTLGFSSGYTYSALFSITQNMYTHAPANPGWDHFFKDLDSAPRLEELYHLQAVIDACYQSASEERWVTVS